MNRLTLYILLLLLISCTKESPKTDCIELESSRVRRGKQNEVTNSTYSVLLDFDGHYVNSSYWNSGMPFYAPPSGSVDSLFILNDIKSRFKNFKISITRDSLEWSKATYKVRCVITTSDFYYGVSGAAYVGSIKQGVDIFVFSHRCYYDSKRIGLVSTHEIGHSIGLKHQARYDESCNLLSSYKGCDIGTMTGPIMGNSIGCLSLWWIGPTPNGCKDIQNDSLVMVNNLK